jgi:hypothetical protein
MAATIEFEDDAASPLTSFNWGAIQDGADSQFKFFAKNTGDQSATSVIISIARLNQNDGVDLALLAADVSGNPDTFSASPLNVGTLAPGDSVAFWLKVTVPSGTTPKGNPRQFDVVADYQGT